MAQRSPPESPTSPPESPTSEYQRSERSDSGFWELQDYKDHFLCLLELERVEEAKQFSEKLTDLPFLCTGTHGNLFMYELFVEELLGMKLEDFLEDFRNLLSDFMFGDEFQLVYPSHGDYEYEYEFRHEHDVSDDQSNDIETVCIFDLNERNHSVVFLGKHPCATELRFFQSLPHKRMVRTIKSLSYKCPLLPLLLCEDTNNSLPVHLSSTPRVDLNFYQQQAIDMALNSKVTLIHGPPGSGKTSVAVALVEELAKYEGKILVCAPSNVATDTLAIRLKQTNLNVVRVYSKGMETKDNIADNFALHFLMHALACAFYPEKTKSLLELKKITRNAVAEVIGKEEANSIETQILDQYQIICCTCCTSGDVTMRRFAFNTVVIDEAAFCSEPEAMIAVSNDCQRLVLIGDPKQLRPIIKSDEAIEGGLDVSLFERLNKSVIEEQLLAIQYRMHPAISAFPNRCFYEGKLRDGIGAAERSLHKYTVGLVFPKSPVLFIDCRGTSIFNKQTKSFSNRQEADLLISIVGLLQRCDVHLNSIGVISAYEDQRKLLIKQAKATLNLTLKDVEIKNIDGYQGREKDFILVTCVRSGDGFGFLTNPNRINVALTRARYGLIIIGNAEHLKSNSIWGQLIQHLEERDGKVTEESFRLMGEPRMHKAKFGFL